MDRIATIAHFSDFHFVGNLKQEKEAFYPLRWFAAAPHSFAKIEALSIAFRTINQDDNGRADLTVVTGDLTTDGAKQSFHTALKYIQDDQIKDEKFTRFMTLGLNTPLDSCLVVPGNHDRFRRRIVGWQTETTKFEEALGLSVTKRNYPAVYGFRPEGASNHVDEPAIIFFLFDTTHPKYKERRLIDSFARGYLSLTECNTLKVESDAIRLNKKVRTLNGSEIAVDYDRCVRIVLLHHDPFEISRKLGLENSLRFRDQCIDAKIDLVMYGHTHRSGIRVDPPPTTRFEKSGSHRVHYICAPSAGEYKSDSGFFIYDIGSSRIQISEYNFDEDAGQFFHKGA